MVRQASLFSQLLKLAPRTEFGGLVSQHGAEKGAKGFTCWNQFVAMLFCHLGHADSLRENLLRAGLLAWASWFTWVSAGPPSTRPCPTPTATVPRACTRISSG